MIKFRLLLFSLIILCFCNCSSKSDLAKEYLTNAIEIMEKNSVNKMTINWSEFKNKVDERSKNIKTIENTYPIIKYALSLLNDRHSFFLLPEQVKAREEDNSPLSKYYFQKDLINNEIGYIRIPSHSSSDSICLVFAGIFQDFIRELDESNLKGWIIDLRDNTGGNMWPMLLAVGPVLGNGIAGYFVDSDTNYVSWTYSDGSISANNTVVYKLESYHTIRNKGKKIAVLIDGYTGSSGEAVAIAFKGLPDTRFFGGYTAGVSTANRGFKLSDGAKILLTTSIFADRNKILYGNEIKPDEIIRDPKEVMKAAVRWINMEMLRLFK